MARIRCRRVAGKGDIVGIAADRQARNECEIYSVTDIDVRRDRLLFVRSLLAPS